MPSDPATWYVMIGEQETGPLTRVELGVELASGAITPDTLVWKEGMIKWLPGSKVPELQALFKAPPRPPRPGGRPPPHPGARPPPPPKPQAKGEGLSSFDTAHFRLQDMQNEEAASNGGASRQMEFDTAHFRLQDLASQGGGGAGEKKMEFDTAHFRLDDVKNMPRGVPKRITPKAPEGPLELDVPGAPAKQPVAIPKSKLQQASTSAKPAAAAPVAVRPTPTPVPATPSAPAKPAAAIMTKGTAKSGAKPGAEEKFDPNRTSVDFRTLGALVQKQAAAQAAFESGIIPDEAPIEEEPPAAPDPKAEELSKWAAKEIENAHKDDPKAAPLKKAAPPPPIAVPHAPHDEKSWIPTAVAIAGVIALLAALVWYLLSGD